MNGQTTNDDNRVLKIRAFLSAHWQLIETARYVIVKTLAPRSQESLMPVL
jgi:hypothetical protein